MSIASQIILFAALAVLGVATRFIYLPIAALQKYVGRKSFTVVLDVIVALIFAAAMLLVCFLLAGNARVTYAVIYLGGIALGHIILSPIKKRAKKNLTYPTDY